MATMLENGANLEESTGHNWVMPQARAVDVGGRRLALASSGKGSPTVVLETGLGAESEAWSEVYQAIARTTRVLRYDRAGRGSSDPAPGRRDALEMVSDLRRLLQVTGIVGPYILVGHSFGGLLMRLFAHRYGESVAGIVLVDSMHEDQFDVFGPLFPPPTSSDNTSLSNIRSFWSGGWRDPAATVERIDLVSSTDQARAIASLNDIPLHVIVAGTFLNQSAVPQEQRADLQRRWETLQRGFMKLSSAATIRLVRSSGHFIQRDAPRAVIDVICKAVSAARCVHKQDRKTQG
jgi:pimeloyl-ACP methyl ester carboxylesterase